MRTIFASALCAFTTMTGMAFAEDSADQSAATVEIATGYLAAYSTFDVGKMAPFLSDEIVFVDPTSADQNADGGPFRFEGKAAVLKGLGDYAAQFKDFHVAYDVKRRYESEGNVVFVADLTWTVVTKDDETATGGAPIVTVVTVKDGKIVEHRDYYDYKENAVTF